VTTPARRAELTEALLRVLGKTWRANDQKGELDDPFHRIAVLRGGCESFLAGDFDAVMDAVSLGLAFLTLAREACILHGLDVLERPDSEGRQGDPS
jgi:hypothetical protein